MSVENFQTEGSNEYIVFSTGGLTFASPLLDVKEIVELSELRKLPNAADHFSGLLNLRGEIIGVLDLAKIFGYTSKGGPSQSILVLDGQGSGLSVKVDMVVSVVSFPAEKIDYKPKISMPMDNKFLIGVTEFSGEILPIIALTQVISNADLVAAKKQIENAAA